MDDALLKSVGDEAVGVISAAYYSADHDSREQQALRGRDAKDYGVLPGGYSAGMYVAGQCVEAALAEARRQGGRPKALATRCTACRSTDTPRGPVAFDEYGNVVGDGVHPPLRAQGRQLVNTIDQDLPEREPVLDLPEAEFLAQPVYSRDYPPAKNLQ